MQLHFNLRVTVLNLSNCFILAMPFLSLSPTPLPFSLWPSRAFVLLPFPPKPAPFICSPLSPPPGAPLSGAQVELWRRSLPQSQPPPCGHPLPGWPLHAALIPECQPSPRKPRSSKACALLPALAETSSKCRSAGAARAEPWASTEPRQHVSSSRLSSRPVRRCRPFS